MKKSIITLKTYLNFKAFENNSTPELLLLDVNEFPFLKCVKDFYNAVICPKDECLVVYERRNEEMKFFIPFIDMKFFKFVPIELGNSPGFERAWT